MAQGNVIAERKDGMREMGRHLEAINGILQSRGNQAQIATAADRIIAFYSNINALYPASSLTPPVPQGRSDGQTRALAAIEPNRAAFTEYSSDMVRQLTAMKTAAATGGVTPEMLRAAGQVCAGCHNQFRAR
ncbi:cytochrome c [Roseomonas sp. AR75]|uniref:cytochrome c n=1 Tax=Roseomonas sp. AR75 TaxID=2562311 RepID=UPI0014857C33|nr:cytochrome c [Roseomonas sp. AR75]